MVSSVHFECPFWCWEWCIASSNTNLPGPHFFRPLLLGARATFWGGGHFEGQRNRKRHINHNAAFSIMYGFSRRRLPKTKDREQSTISSSTVGPRRAAFRRPKFSCWHYWTWWNIRSTTLVIIRSSCTASMPCICLFFVVILSNLVSRWIYKAPKSRIESEALGWVAGWHQRILLENKKFKVFSESC